MIGARLPAIKKAEDRELFKQAMYKIGLEVPRSGKARNFQECLEIIETMNFPVIIRPSFTLGGMGGGIAYNREEYEDMVRFGLDCSPVSEILIEESVIGWKEFELEVMRDKNDNVVIICSIENFDPMGVHTGDSITVAPAQTLTDKEYQVLRDASIRIIREIGVDTGGSNIQFSMNPENGKVYVIEMKPRFAFEKFSKAAPTLTTQMKSVGEAMAMGRTFKEALLKAMRSLETGSYGFESKIRTGRPEPVFRPTEPEMDVIKSMLKTPRSERLWYIAEALRGGLHVDDIHELTNIDRWFLNNIREIVEIEEGVFWQGRSGQLSKEILRKAKEAGFSIKNLASLSGKTEDEIKAALKDAGIVPVFKTV